MSRLQSLLLVSLCVATGGLSCYISTPSRCCASLDVIGLGERLLFRNTTGYTEREESFFSLNERLEPTCIFQPVDKHEVSLGLTTLLKVPGCQLAIRSGGHHHAAGSNNIHHGVTIDLVKLNGVSYSQDSKTTTVGPGAQWGAVYRYLDPLGLAVAGGRDATVGVGGLIVGGGNSFYSARRGMVCDGVVRFEVVLANGEIITADKDNNSDLWVALKGGNNNFGIVTSFDLDTFENGLLWGGTVYYGLDKRQPLVDAFVNFAENIDDNTASSSILFWSWQPSVKTTLIGTSFVNVDNVVYDAPHKEFFAIENVTSSMRSTTVTDLTEELEFVGEIYDCVEFTFSFKNDPRVMNKIIDLHDAVVAEFGQQSDDFISIAMFQPLAQSYAREGLARGGNVLGLDTFKETRVLSIIWLQVKPEHVASARALVQSWYEEIQAFAMSISRDSGWIYLNYAHGTQDPISGYGKANVDKIRAAAAKYDPTGFFQTRVPGGFKISKVPK
ncbi:prosolanapyrone-II oxidase [Microdochium nivale]|nr:prosolanapyrone-II oxidase [Microdochium nivale]